MARGSYQEMAAQKAARKKHNKAAAKTKATVPHKAGSPRPDMAKQFKANARRKSLGGSGG